MPRPAPFIISPPEDFLENNPVLAEMAVRLANVYESREMRVDETQLRAVGTALWEALQPGDALDKAKEKAGLGVLPVIIESDDAGVQALPWETLYHPGREIFVGRAPGFALSRRGAGIGPDLPEPEQGPLRVLLFSSLPDDLGHYERLDVEAEQAAVQEALLEGEKAGEIRLEMPDDGRFDTFKEWLQTFRPHVVYMSGHGNFTHEHHNARAWGSFLFEDPEGRGISVPEEDISGCFQNTGVQLLVLSACLSGKHHPDYPENGLARRLYRNGIPYVVGMRESVMDRAGIKFAHALLGGIAERHPADIALQAARGAIVDPGVGDIYRREGDPAREAMSLGQWCLPVMMAYDNGRSLVDWDFVPEPMANADQKNMLGEVTVPERFIGRRRELRQWQNALRRGEKNSLLVTGAGGMGKTALAGKLVKGLGREGYRVYSFSLQPEHTWEDVLTEMEVDIAENESLYRKLEIHRRKGVSPAKEAEYILDFLLQLSGGKLALFFDNLESVQDIADPHSLTDESLALWIDAARKKTGQGLRLILTSRWRLPDWPDDGHFQAGRPVYGDYLAFARLRGLSADKARLRRLYDGLGGNFRALEFFAKAAEGMSLEDEKTFLSAMKEATAEIQTNMAIAEVMAQRSDEERELLNRLVAFQTTVPEDGATVLFAGWHLPEEKRIPDADAVALLRRLADVSLVEQYRATGTGLPEYGLSPLVRSLLQDDGAAEPDRDLLVTAAEYLLWLWEEDLNVTWPHLMATHQALKDAGLESKRQRLILDYVVGHLNRNGMYQHLLDEWLLPLPDAEDPQVLGETLGQIGKQYHHLGDYKKALDYLKKSLSIQKEIGDKYGEGTTLNNMATTAHARGDYETALDYLKKSLSIQKEIGDKSGEGTTLNNISGIYRARGDHETALDYLKKSLSIWQEIGDTAGLCTTLFNMGHIHLQNEEPGDAMEAWVTVYRIAKKINLAQVLDALEGLADGLGLPGKGLEAWERLLNQSGDQD